MERLIAQAKAWAYLRSKNKYRDSGFARMMGKEKQTTTEILAFGFAQARMTTPWGFARMTDKKEQAQSRSPTGMTSKTKKDGHEG
jgi:hypothetical protein